MKRLTKKSPFSDKKIIYTTNSENKAPKVTAASEKHGPQDYVLHTYIELQLEASGYFHFLLFHKKAIEAYHGLGGQGPTFSRSQQGRVQRNGRKGRSSFQTWNPMM